MKVLDATFLIDYLAGEQAAAEYLLDREDERFVFPLPAYTEVLVGEGDLPNGDIGAVKADLHWGEVYTPTEATATIAGEIAGEISAEGPHLEGMDALIAAVGRELNGTIVSSDRDLTHPETKAVIPVDEYRGESA